MTPFVQFFAVRRTVSALQFLLGAVLLGLYGDPPAASAFNTSVPPGSGIIAIGGHPEPRTDPKPLIEHVPLGNLLNFEVDFVNQGTVSLTFTEGRVQFFDKAHNPILGEKAFGPATFDSVAFRIPGPNPVGSGATIPVGERIIMFFPFEQLAHNVVPATVDIRLFFSGFADPLAFLDIALSEYAAPPGQTYVYPMTTPVKAGGQWFSGGGHELATGHRRGGLRTNGNTAWVNQRYAYDISVVAGGVDCDDGNGNSGDSCTGNPNYFVWGEPIHAIADGQVVLLIQGNADNPEPRCAARQDCSLCTSYDGGPNMDQPVPPLCPFTPGAGLCNNQPNAGLCGASNPCPPGAFPGSGNQVVLLHPNGEFSTYAHMMMGSNDHLSCGQFVNQGDVLGQVGMTGTGSNPHHHFSTLSTPGPEAPIAENFPIYFNNIEFVTSGGLTPRRQLDVSLPSGTLITSILLPPSPIPSNVASPPGLVAETEPNDTLAQHQTLALPATVHGTAELAEPIVDVAGDIAVRGDGIEDIYRINLATASTIQIQLIGLDATQNLDVYTITENLRVLNKTGEGTSGGPDEEMCLVLTPGAYYVLVSNVDSTKTADADYVLDIAKGGAPVLTIPGTLDLGAACAGGTRTAVLNVCNTGGDTPSCALEVGPIVSSDPQFSVTTPSSGYPVKISTDFCFPFEVRFTPTSAGTKTAMLTIPSNDPNHPSVTLTVTGTTPETTIAVAPDQSFAPEVIQSAGVCTSTRPFPISNSGVCNVKITDIMIGGANATDFALSGLPSLPITLEPGHLAGEGALKAVFGPTAVDRDRIATLSVTYETDPITHATATVTRNLCGEGLLTGARVLVRAGGVPLPVVEQIRLQRINGNRKKEQLDTQDVARNVELQTVTPAGVCSPFQFHREYGTVDNPVQLLPGSYQVTVAATVNGKRQQKAVGFDVTTCDFNPTVIVDF